MLCAVDICVSIRFGSVHFWPNSDRALPITKLSPTTPFKTIMTVANTVSRARASLPSVADNMIEMIKATLMMDTAMYEEHRRPTLRASS